MFSSINSRIFISKGNKKRDSTSYHFSVTNYCTILLCNSIHMLLHYKYYISKAQYIQRLAFLSLVTLHNLSPPHEESIEIETVSLQLLLNKTFTTFSTHDTESPHLHLVSINMFALSHFNPVCKHNY